MNKLVKIGKIKEFNGLKGTVVDGVNEYWFLNSDLLDLSIKPGDLVIFRDENCLDKRVFFISKATNEKIKKLQISKSGH